MANIVPYLDKLVGHLWGDINTFYEALSGLGMFSLSSQRFSSGQIFFPALFAP
jgi:hypothetical protein